MIHGHAKYDRPAADLAVLDILLGAGRNIYVSVEYFSAIGATKARYD
jgi:hypothetical protein